jgi:predicted nucleic acid-binding protein
VIHFDSNFLVAAFQAGSPEETRFSAWLRAKEPLGLSAVAWAEFFSGPLSKRDEALARQLFPRIEALSGADAEMAAQLFNQTGRRSRSLADCMIAAVAIRCGARLATLNIADFQPFIPHGLALA